MAHFTWPALTGHETAQYQHRSAQAVQFCTSGWEQLCPNGTAQLPAWEAAKLTTVPVGTSKEHRTSTSPPKMSSASQSTQRQLQQPLIHFFQHLPWGFVSAAIPCPILQQ